MSDIKTPYLNLQTDFGFKFVFGSIANKGALLRFLNALFHNKLTITAPRRFTYFRKTEIKTKVIW